MTDRSCPGVHLLVLFPILAGCSLEFLDPIVTGHWPTSGEPPTTTAESSGDTGDTSDTGDTDDESDASTDPGPGSDDAGESMTAGTGTDTDVGCGTGWARTFPNPTWGEQVRDLAVDGAGNVVVLGRFEGAADYGSGPMAGERQIFLAAFGPDGEALWSRHFDEGGGDGPQGVVFDAAGDVVFHGFWHGDPIDFGGGPLAEAPGIGNSAYLVKLSAAGEHVWSRVFTNSTSTASDDLAAAPDGGLVFALHSAAPLDFGGGPRGGGDATHTFLVRYDADGAHLWSRTLTAAGGLAYARVGVAPGGEVVVGGRQWTDVQFVGGPVSPDDESSMFVVQLSPAGDFEWHYQPSGVATSGPHLMGLAVDGAGRVHLSGSFGNDIDFGGGPLVAAGGLDVFAAALDADGAHLWSRRYGQGGAFKEEQNLALAVDAAGHRAMVGVFDGGVDFADGPLVNPNPDHYDGFVAQVGPDGALGWSAALGGTGHQIAAGAAIDGAGSVWVAGISWGEFSLGDQQIATAEHDYDVYLTRLCR